MSNIAVLLELIKVKITNTEVNVFKNVFLLLNDTRKLRVINYNYRDYSIIEVACDLEQHES